MRDIKQIIIHHSVSPRDQELNKSITSFDKNHAERLHTTKNKLGYHIAYHYVVAGNGQYKKTRMRDEVGFHASNLKVNNESIGICLTGNFDIEKPSKAQYDSLNKIIAEIKVAYPNATIHGHNEYAKKTCPGHNFDFTQLQNIIMLFYENMRNKEIKSIPKEKRAFKDPYAFIDRIKDLKPEEQMSETAFMIAIVAQNIASKNSGV